MNQIKNLDNLKVALVHDQLNQAGGAERVLLTLSYIFPKAPIYTIIHDTDRLKGFEDKKIITSFIQKLPFSKRLFKWYLPIMPSAVENLNLSGYDLVISSSSALIKGIITNPGTTHICYCHTPTRYLWSDAQEYSEKLNTPNIVKKILPIYLSRLRLWDQLASQRVDHYIANSNFIKERIKNYYRKDACVVYPPIDVHNYQISNNSKDYFLMIGRLRPYKKFDLAIKAFNKLQIPLKIIGTGEQEKELKSMAGKYIEFLGSVKEEQKRKLIADCRAFINPQIEDFGITAIEAMASGRPVIAYKEGGAVEQITPGVNGEFIEDQTWEALIDKIIHFDYTKYDPNTIKKGSEKYSTENFIKNIKSIINDSIQKHL